LHLSPPSIGELKDGRGGKMLELNWIATDTR